MIMHIIYLSLLFTFSYYLKQPKAHKTKKFKMLLSSCCQGLTYLSILQRPHETKEESWEAPQSSASQVKMGPY